MYKRDGKAKEGVRSWKKEGGWGKQFDTKSYIFIYAYLELFVFLQLRETYKNIDVADYNRLKVEVRQLEVCL